MASSSSSTSRSTPLWLHCAVPAACLATTYLLYGSKTKLLTWVYDRVAKSGRNPLPGKAYLTGNFAPVDDELFSEDLPVVEGKLPPGLDGCYVRAGPNPFFKPVAGYHWFDGDGMLHAVRIRNGRVSYCNRYVDTERLRQERAAGRPLFPRLGDLVGQRGLTLMLLNRIAQALGVVRIQHGSGTANTALVYHSGRLLALNEGDLPYGVRVGCSGLIETLGRLRFSKAWSKSFTAHPKIDPVNGELLFIGYRFDANPYVSAGVMDEYGNLVRHWGVELPYPVMMHDLAVTEHYVVLLHLPLCFDPQAMVKDRTVPFKLRTDLPSRIGLLRREQPSCPAGGAEVTWLELPGPGAMAFHVATAWEDAAGDVKVFACQMDELNMDLDAADFAKEAAHLTEYTLSPSAGTASLRRLSQVAGDFPVVHPGKATRSAKWAWMATLEPSGSVPSFTGIAKLDLTPNKPGKDACVSRITYPPGCFGGEAVFVPRASTLADPRAAKRCSEDDGWLMVYVYDTNADVSYMNLYDARTMSAKPVTSVRMPRRVPYGFHGTWVSEYQMKAQVMWV
ncbi:hypothetical protein Agub_g13935 [Astrephomene gubernaculifera]|uniref:carotenoid 9,10-dioxygenase n=1 Tax=Astrephomene gubernaculifera TaxID=47775 RepID=A0AAD3E2Q4_9CHLO|nr:hypothetical protein Agub_g13935 [Astrephomene gubernaculifera]